MMERSIDVKTRHYPQGNNNTKGIYKKKEEEEAQLESNLEERIIIAYSNIKYLFIGNVC